MSNEYIITLLSCVLLYTAFWLSIDYHPQKSYWHTYRTRVDTKRKIF